MRIAVIIGCLLALTMTVHSQVDVLVPFDDGGKILVITKDLNDKMRLFPPLESFVESHLYRQADSTVVLEIIRRDGAATTRARSVLTAAELASIRMKVAQFLLDNDLAVPMTRDMQPRRDDDRAVSVSGYDQSGRSGMLWGSTLWSLIYYGTAASYTFGLYDNESASSGVAATYIIAGGLGYLVPALLTNDAPVTAGASSLALGGMFQGAIHGWLLAGLIGGDDVSDRLGFGLSMLTGVSESVAGYLIGTSTNITEGTAGVVNTTEFYGMASGALLGLVFVGTDGTSNASADIRIVTGLGLAGAVGGLFLGQAIADVQRYSSTDATIFGVTGFLGALLPISVMAAVNVETVDPRALSGITILGIAGGLAAGAAIVLGKDYRSGDATGVVLGTVAGGLIGGGVALLTESTLGTPMLIWGGAAAGFGIGLAMAHPEIDLGLGGTLDIDINPLGLVLGSSLTRPVPVGSLTYRF